MCGSRTTRAIPPEYLGYAPGPLADRTWTKFQLTPPRDLSNDDLYVMVQQPGGAYPGAGWWIAFDHATTTQRSSISYDGQNWVTKTEGDALIQIIGRPNPTPTPTPGTAVCAGISWSLTTSAANTALIWTPNALLGHLENVPTADDIRFQGRSVSDVQGIVYSPTQLQALIWTRDQVFLRKGVTTTVDEVQGPGGSIQNVRGMVYAPDGSRALIWTDTQVLIHRGVTGTATGVQGPGGSIRNVRGIAFAPDSNSALIWTDAQILLQRGVMTTAQEVRFQGSSIDQVQGVVFAPDRAASKALIWTDARVLLQRGVMSTASEIRSQGRSLSVVQGIVFAPDASASKALIWTHGRVVLHRGVMSTADEVRFQGGSISDVQGIACSPDGARELIWTDGRVLMQRGVLSTVQEVRAQGSSLAQVRGITFSTVTGTHSSEALIWTDAQVQAQKGVLTTTDEVREGGQSIGGVRGIVFCPGSGGTASEALIWTGARVLRHMPVSPAAEELLAQGRSLAHVQGIVWAVSEALIMTPTQVFSHMAIVPTAQEVTLTGGGSIYSFNPAQQSSLQAVVHHQGLQYGGSHGEPPIPTVTHMQLSGASMVGQPAITWVNYTGSATGATEVPSSMHTVPHTTILGAAPFNNSAMILGPDPVAGVVAGNAMKVFGTAGSGPVPVLESGRDIGTTGGSDFHVSGVYTIVAGGADIWGYADEFHYVYTSVTGDFEISARVYDLDNTDPWAKAGVMARESLDPGARHAFMCVTPQDGEGRMAFQHRSISAYDLSGSLHTAQGQVSFPHNTWVKLKRQGNVFTAYMSTDGMSWEKFPGMLPRWTDGINATNPVAIKMPATIYVGLAVTSHAQGVLCTAHFDAVTLQR